MIKSIKVENLWGERSVEWSLKPGVNILSGSNGSGKSTILKSVYRLFQEGTLPSEYHELFDSISVELSDGATYTSELPFNPDYIKGNVYSNLFSSKDYRSEDVLSFTSDDKFCDLVDDYFKLTRKKIVRNSSELKFQLHSGKQISPMFLSSGEKELMLILSIACLATGDDVIILDEPEISLHFDWQKTLLDSIIETAPNAQIIVSTHSPAIIMNGWLDCVDNIDDITTLKTEF